MILLGTSDHVCIRAPVGYLFENCIAPKYITLTQRRQKSNILRFDINAEAVTVRMLDDRRLGYPSTHPWAITEIIAIDA